MTADDLSRIVVDTGLQVHRELGPGLLESVYEMVLAAELERAGLHVERQKPISFDYRGLRFENAFRIDLLIEDQLIVEIKSIEKLGPVHAKQVLTYLRLSNRSLGLLINFGGETFKEGIRRLVNNHK